MAITIEFYVLSLIYSLFSSLILCLINIYIIPLLYHSVAEKYEIVAYTSFLIIPLFFSFSFIFFFYLKCFIEFKSFQFKALLISSIILLVFTIIINIIFFPKMKLNGS